MSESNNKGPIARSQFSKHPRFYAKASTGSKTKQSFKAECDINNILARYQKTGLVGHLNARQPRYGDFSNTLDYQAALNAVMAAEESFSSLPAKVRDRFQNDPSKLISFINDPKNKNEAIKLGLLEQKTQQTKKSSSVEIIEKAPSGQLPLDVTGRTDTEGKN